MPRRVLVPSPDMRPEALKSEDLTDLQRRELFQMQEIYRETGRQIHSHYAYNL